MRNGLVKYVKAIVAENLCTDWKDVEFDLQHHDVDDDVEFFIQDTKTFYDVLDLLKRKGREFVEVSETADDFFKMNDEEAAAFLGKINYLNSVFWDIWKESKNGDHVFKNISDKEAIKTLLKKEVGDWVKSKSQVRMGESD